MTIVRHNNLPPKNDIYATLVVGDYFFPNNDPSQIFMVTNKTNPDNENNNWSIRVAGNFRGELQLISESALVQKIERMNLDIQP